MSKNYNGWTNYETWLINLWMDNDQGAYDCYRAIAKTIYLKAKHKNDACHEFADFLRERFYDHRPELCGVYSDLLNGALSEVNWLEVARFHIDAVEADLVTETKKGGE